MGAKSLSAIRKAFDDFSPTSLAVQARHKAIEIMAARVGLSAQEYEPFLAGTKILNREEAMAFFANKPGFDSLYGSTRISDEFNVKYQAYSEPQKVEQYIDSGLTAPAGR
jgi:NitT/TauT family transport system substrate-binding protein